MNFLANPINEKIKISGKQIEDTKKNHIEILELKKK